MYCLFIQNIFDFANKILFDLKPRGAIATSGLPELKLLVDANAWQFSGKTKLVFSAPLPVQKRSRATVISQNFCGKEIFFFKVILFSGAKRFTPEMGEVSYF